MKQNPLVIANAAGITTAIVFVVCRFLVGIFPDLMTNIAKSWFHSFELTTAINGNLTTELFVLGLVTAAITAWLIGYLFAVVYSVLAKK